MFTFNQDLLWTTTSVYLYVEIVTILLLVLPIGKAEKWADLSELRMFRNLRKPSKGIFMCLFIILVFVFMYDVLETWKLSKLEAETETFSTTQRNLYISGWALFLSLVMHQLINYILTEARLTAEFEEVKQKKTASNSAEKYTLILRGNRKGSTKLE